VIENDLAGSGLAGRDMAGKAHGIEVEEVHDGYARLAMTVREDMINGHGICHGGMVFFLADTALGHAANADPSADGLAVTSGADVVFCAPATLGDTLTVECRRRHRQGRSSVYELEVTAGDGTVIALLHGQMVRRR
jgi:acyl-CoA thioesterase